MWTVCRAATAGKEGKVWSVPRFWVSILSHKKQPVKNFWDRILDLAWLKFAVATLVCIHNLSPMVEIGTDVSKYGETICPKSLQLVKSKK